MAKAMWVLFAVVFAGFCTEASPLAQKQGNPPNPFAVAKMARYVLHASGNNNHSIRNLISNTQLPYGD